GLERLRLRRRRRRKPDGRGWGHGDIVPGGFGGAGDLETFSRSGGRRVLLEHQLCEDGAVRRRHGGGVEARADGGGGRQNGQEVDGGHADGRRFRSVRAAPAAPGSFGRASANAGPSAGVQFIILNYIYIYRFLALGADV